MADFHKLYEESELARIAAERERDLYFTHSWDLMAIVGKDGYFKRTNPAFFRAMGYTEEELRAKPIVDFLHPEDVERTKKGIRTLAGGTPTISSTNRYLCKNGEYRWFSWNTQPLGDIFLTIGRDITEDKRKEEQIRATNVELERAIEERMQQLREKEAQVQQLQKMDAIGRLAGGIAHDFNNMLSAISLYCDILMERAEHPALVRDNVKEIVATTGRAAALTRQLLVFSRKQLVQTQVLELNPIIEQVQKMLVRLIGPDIQFSTKLAPDLRAIDADPSQIEQILINLVVNARDAMPHGGTLQVETANVHLDESFTSTHLEVKEGDYVSLAVSDTGTGMDGITVHKIFEPFFTTKPAGKGTGLGLTTVYGIVKQCEGTIWVYSEPGQGTIFKIYLPASQGVPSEARPFAAAASLRAPGVSQTILLVEDDHHLRSGFSLMLRSRGYEVISAATGREALIHCEGHKGTIDLMLTDVIMPEMNGFELARKAAKLRPEMRVLFMSGYADDKLGESSLAGLQAQAFIQKPFGTNALIDKLREVMAQPVRMIE